MADWQNDLERYRQGKMTPVEMHAFEKRALQDPFLADAIEGAESISTADFASDVSAINEQLSRKLSKEEIAQMAASSQPKITSKPIKFLWPLRIAASLIIIAGLFWLVIELLPSRDNANLALKKSENSTHLATPKPSADTLIQNQAIQNSGSENKNSVALNAPSKKLIVPKQAAAGTTSTPPASIEEPKTPAGIADTKAQAEEIKLTDADLTERVAEVESAPSFEKKEVASPSVYRSSRAAVVGSFIKGKVTSSEDGNPLPGVNVIIKGTTEGTVTDYDGNFQLPISNTNQKIVFSFIGLQTKEVNATQAPLQVALDPDVAQLSEVVVTGAGKRDDTEREPIIRLAVPAGGLKAYDAYLENSLRYPPMALEKKIKGKVTVKFTVRIDGSLDEFRVVKSLGNGCDEEVIRLVKEGPEWSPTTQDNEPVESEVLVKVKFDPAKAKP
jgi:TonB family protein